MSFFQNHPFAVEAYFKSSVVLTFAVPKEQLQSMLPERLELDLFQDKWGFLAVAMVDTCGLRPKGFPTILGNNFFLIGYRLFVRYTNKAGKRLRGLYILRSETNKKKMEFLGNIFTQYKYTTTDIEQFGDKTSRIIQSKNSNFRVELRESNETIPLPAGSPFSNWKEARMFAGPLPFTFSCSKKNDSVLIIEGVRENWTPIPLQVKDYYFNFLETLPIQDPILANAFEIKNIPYFWKKGKIEKWT
ncbi:MAG: DUF2071 domain-containing protein [Chitinophagales bacterium]|nr:DUF2071 domain-containing protein [Chitinophagales bacterium]